jgi:hypothetical protein
MRAKGAALPPDQGLVFAYWLEDCTPRTTHERGRHEMFPVVRYAVQKLRVPGGDCPFGRQRNVGCEDSGAFEPSVSCAGTSGEGLKCRRDAPCGPQRRIGYRGSSARPVGTRVARSRVKAVRRLRRALCGGSRWEPSRKPGVCERNGPSDPVSWYASLEEGSCPGSS